ncbi:MAG TPA: 5-dehydro-4-deoxy-D-glucuronate isomerase [Halanaerobiales bacterium]|nr:5-dehydro-4-deoxy-D-glucuronate isomerase [Halanaerobiales bacterium]
MEIRNAVHPADFVNYDTELIRKEFLIQQLFNEDEIKLVYSHIDRIITGGIKPVNKELKLEAGKEIGAEYFLARREMGVINIGAEGIVIIDGEKYELASRDGLYIGMGNEEIIFSSKDTNNPAKFYLNSAPAHRAYPTKKINIKDAKPQEAGSLENSNKRTIYKYLHPDVVDTCQLLMGMTLLEPKNVWNTMPCHTHDRRMEVYFYFDIADDDLVFHLMGEPDETRHLVVRNEEAIINPSWSIHSGVGTGNYTFIWGMVGENQTFSDMDDIGMNELR